jgi:hypothetical protein
MKQIMTYVYRPRPAGKLTIKQVLLDGKPGLEVTIEAGDKSETCCLLPGSWELPKSVSSTSPRPSNPTLTRTPGRTSLPGTRPCARRWETNRPNRQQKSLKARSDHDNTARKTTKGDIRPAGKTKKSLRILREVFHVSQSKRKGQTDLSTLRKSTQPTRKQESEVKQS